MPQELNMREAIKLAIETEKNVMDFYLKAANLTNNERGKKVFTLLAGEEREHAAHFFKIYTGKDLGTFDEFINSPPSPTFGILRELDKDLAADVNERKAMELAMKEEEDLVKNLRLTSSRIIDPAVRAVFERMAVETEHHYAIIESEYAHMMGMVHETDIDTYVRE